MPERTLTLECYFVSHAMANNYGMYVQVTFRHILHLSINKTKYESFILNNLINGKPLYLTGV